jgi:hypothetical protein
MSLYVTLSQPVTATGSTVRSTETAAPETIDEHIALDTLAPASIRTTFTKVRGETSDETQSLTWPTCASCID